MSDRTLIDFKQPVPIFPLQACVLLPEVTVKLHIFESRYRQMLSDVLDSHGLIAMAMFEGEQWKADYEGKPPIRPIVCVGYVVQHQRLDDGRYLILLQGLERATVLEELPHEPYRLGKLQRVAAPADEPEELPDLRRALESMLWDPLLATLASVAAMKNLVTHELPTPALVDIACFATCDDDDFRYACLAEGSVRARGVKLLDYLKRTRCMLEIAQRQGTGRLSNGEHPN
jgi:Lon protease-like protein